MVIKNLRLKIDTNGLAMCTVVVMLKDTINANHGH